MASPTKKPHKWTEAQRTVLNLLNTQLNLEVHARTQIFNTVFQDELNQAGIHGGLEDGALKWQWRDRAHKGREHLWQGALRGPRTDAEKAARKRLVDKIRGAANTLGISIENEANADDNEAGPSEAEDSATADLTEPGGEVESEDGSSIPEANLIARTPNQDVLDMLHTNSVSWNQDGASIRSLTDATIASSSPYYKHSGEIRRIRIQSGVCQGNPEADFILCDAEICPRCSDPSTPIVQFPAERLPFVHSSDTTMIERRTHFNPKSKDRPTGRAEKTFLRYVQFKSLNRDVACWVRVCGYVGCAVCMSNEQTGEAGAA